MEHGPVVAREVQVALLPRVVVEGVAGGIPEQGAQGAEGVGPHVVRRGVAAAMEVQVHGGLGAVRVGPRRRVPGRQLRVPGPVPVRREAMGRISALGGGEDVGCLGPTGALHVSAPASANTSQLRAARQQREPQAAGGWMAVESPTDKARYRAALPPTTALPCT